MNSSQDQNSPFVVPTGNKKNPFGGSTFAGKNPLSSPFLSETPSAPSPFGETNGNAGFSNGFQSQGFGQAATVNPFQKHF